MFDKYLCKRIQKKHIKISDVIEYIASEYIPVLAIIFVAYLIMLAMGMMVYMALDINQISYTTRLNDWIYIHIYGLSSVGVIWLFMWIIKRIQSIEIATCPNVKDEEK